MYLLQPGDFSAFHRIHATELWHFYGGDPSRMVLLATDGSVRRVTLGNNLRAQQRPVIAVPAGWWMAAETMGEWTLTGTTVAPPFESSRFELGRRDDLLADYPEAVVDIRKLTRE